MSLEYYIDDDDTVILDQLHSECMVEDNSNHETLEQYIEFAEHCFVMANKKSKRHSGRIALLDAMFTDLYVKACAIGGRAKTDLVKSGRQKSLLDKSKYRCYMMINAHINNLVDMLKQCKEGIQPKTSKKRKRSHSF